MGRVSPKLALLCAPDGRVTSVLRDDLCLLSSRREPLTLAAVFDEKDGARLLANMKRRTDTFGSVLAVRANECPGPMHVATQRWERDVYLVTGSTDAEGLLSLLEECSLARGYEQERTASAPEHDTLNELTMLNNELVNLQRQLAKRNAELLALTKHRNELLAIAAHDLRNPLMVVQTYCELLLSRQSGALDHEKQCVVGKVLEAAELMQHVLEGTLDFARVEAGSFKLNLVDLSIETVVAAALQTYKPLAEQKRISMRLEKKAPMPVQQLDPVRMAQVVGNLVSNAIKYSPLNGNVWLTLSRRGDNVVLSVRDQGQGIQRDELSMLFQPFKTTSTRPTAGEPSTGLGLAIVDKLVEAHGGKVHVDSEIGRGSTFEIELPVRVGGASASSSERQIHRGS